MELNGLDDLLLPEENKDSFENFTDVKEYTMDEPEEDKNSKIFYLDDNHNIVDKSVATKSVIQVYDENGNMIEEVWSVLKPEENKEDDKSVVTLTYVDEDGNEVAQEAATHVVYKTFIDDKLVSENKYTLDKSVSL